MIEIKPPNDFQKLLHALIQINQQNRKNFPPEVKLSLSGLAYAFDLCTVRCDIGRRSGKSEYIKMVAVKGDLVIVHNHQCLHQHKGSEYRTVVADDDRLKTIRSMGPFKTIYIDEAELVFQLIDKHELYLLLVWPGVEQTFVLLG